MGPNVCYDNSTCRRCLDTDLSRIKTGELYMKSKLETQALSAFSVIQYPDMSIADGETVFLSGPSGCGKSTLLRLFNGMLTPSSGQILLDGEDIAGLSPIPLRRRVLLTGQAVYLLRGTIAENFLFFHQYHETPPPDREKIQALLETCAAPFLPEASCDTMSGGERQRVFLSVALSMKPEVLLLDEPTSALDGAVAGTVFQNIKQYCRDGNMTLIVVSHDPGLRDTYADRIIRLEARK